MDFLNKTKNKNLLKSLRNKNDKKWDDVNKEDEKKKFFELTHDDLKLFYRMGYFMLKDDFKTLSILVQFWFGLLNCDRLVYIIIYRL